MPAPHETGIGYIMYPGPDEEELDAAQSRLKTCRETREGRFMWACDILHNMSLEYSRPWWRRMFGRWYISDEPLRNDAANFLREVGDKRMDSVGRAAGG